VAFFADCVGVHVHVDIVWFVPGAVQGNYWRFLAVSCVGVLACAAECFSGFHTGSLSVTIYGFAFLGDHEGTELGSLTVRRAMLDCLSEGFVGYAYGYGFPADDGIQTVRSVHASRTAT